MRSTCAFEINGSLPVCLANQFAGLITGDDGELPIKSIKTYAGMAKQRACHCVGRMRVT